MTVSTLIAPKIQAGQYLNVEPERTSVEEHLRLLSEGLSTVGAGMIIAQTKVVAQTSENSIKTMSWFDLSNLSIQVVVPIPARAYVDALLEVEVVNDCEGFQARLVNGATAISVTRTRRAAPHLLFEGSTNTTIWEVRVRTTLDLVKQTSYTFKAQAQLDGAGAEYNVRTASTLRVRIEPRSER